MELAVSIFVFCSAFLSTIAVDRSNFKTCDQSGFCKRHRAMQDGQSPYMVMMESIAIQDNTFAVTIINTDNQVSLRLDVTALIDNTARLRITEEKPIKERYEPPVGDVLTKEPSQQKISVQHDSSSIVASFQGNQIIIQNKPFRIDFVVESEPVITINSRGLLKFEEYRQRNEGLMGRVFSWLSKPFREAEPQDPAVPEKDDQHPEEEGDGDSQEEEKEEKEEKEEENHEEPDMWEETFKSHKDTKPFGPSSVGMDISFPGFEYVYGIPEHADTLALKSTKGGEPYRLYNLDVFEYELNNPMALYGSVPVMLAHNEKRTVGMFWLNAAETWVDLNSNVADKNMFSKLVDFIKRDSEIPQIDSHWFSESGIIDVFIMLGSKPKDVFRQYASLTGTTPLPPLFAIAYHQSRWNYNDEQDVKNVDAGFDEADIPLDVIWLDIEHTDGKRYFTWDKHKFPTPADMIDHVASKGRKMVTIIDPHIKRDDDYFLHKEGRDLGYYIKNKDNQDYDGWCWPGSSGWLDFLNPDIRMFWAQKFLPSAYEGSTLDLYTWNDMNEPSVFNGPETTMHKDAKHFGGWEHRDVHNIYGTYVHRASMEGQLLRTDNKRRAFVLSRAFFAGSQRYGAVWTGDNMGEWSHLKISIPMVLSLNLVGITFSGADIGGFFKNPEAELLTRWYQAASYQPFFRAHAHLDTRRREPWLVPEEHEKAIRQAVRARYALLPFWYTLYFQSELSGEPIVKPLWVEFPEDKNSFVVEDQHLVGTALLVHPVTDPGATGVHIYLPGQEQLWYDIDTNAAYPGGQNIYMATNLEKVPVFQKGGTIIPRKMRIRRASALMVHDPYTLYVALNKKNEAQGELYIDDYDTFQYKEGKFIYRSFTFKNNQLSNQNINPLWDPTLFQTKSWLERVIITGFHGAPASVELFEEGAQPVSLQSSYDAKQRTLTIRKPAVNIASEWTIQLR